MSNTTQNKPKCSPRGRRYKQFFKKGSHHPEIIDAYVKDKLSPAEIKGKFNVPVHTRTIWRYLRRTLKLKMTRSYRKRWGKKIQASRLKNQEKFAPNQLQEFWLWFFYAKETKRVLTHKETKRQAKKIIGLSNSQIENLVTKAYFIDHTLKPWGV